MASVELDNVSKKFSNLKVVNNVSLRIDDKEFVVFVGPSGCGKTTTLRMIAGLESVSSGKIYIGDTIVNDLPAKDRDVSMVFQNYALFPHMNVYDNISFGLKVRKYPKHEIEKRVQEATSMLGISHMLNRKPRELSGGERQRVAMGRSIVRQPKVFLFDEPLSNLDAKLRVHMRSEIKRLHDRLQTTVVYVTHDQTEALTLADRIAVIKNGAMQQIGPPMEVYENPQNTFVGGFIGSPAMNFLNVALTRDGQDKLFAHANDIRLPIPDQKARLLEQHVDRELILGIRPEHFMLNPDDTSQAQGIVEMIEPVGADTFIIIKMGDYTLTAKDTNNTNPKKQSVIKFDVNMQKASFFSTEGEALR